jgi:hypothetical protein
MELSELQIMEPYVQRGWRVLGRMSEMKEIVCEDL